MTPPTYSTGAFDALTKEIDGEAAKLALRVVRTMDALSRLGAETMREKARARHARSVPVAPTEGA